MECQTCNKSFRDIHNLKRHQNRATSCAIIIDGEKSDTSCRFCGRVFASKQSMARHVQKYCKVATTAEGMDHLLDHTLKRQLAIQAVQIEDQKHQLDKQATQINNLEAQMKNLSTTQFNGPVNNGTVINITIAPWDGDQRVAVTPAQVLSAFTESRSVREYAALDVHDQADPEKAPPFVADLMMDLVRRAHADPAARNAYINPKRADQVLVIMKTGKWEVLPFEKAAELILEGVADGMHRISRKEKLELETQGALSMAEMMYRYEPEEYTRRTRPQMAAHLANTAPEKKEVLAAGELK